MLAYGDEFGYYFPIRDEKNHRVIQKVLMSKKEIISGLTQWYEKPGGIRNPFRAIIDLLSSYKIKESSLGYRLLTHPEHRKRHFYAFMTQTLLLISIMLILGSFYQLSSSNIFEFFGVIIIFYIIYIC
ncbi:MAG: hypothetical protein HeimC3_47430 [Candidatus Heimdallarchaeota archaeon LC_3]|nr:MAG: hypothetical protein HeimC3_47430 [Candidatus Heimdallarchaeota archaeon LC_3]